MIMTSNDVMSILGPVDETLIAEVVATGATQAELAEAFAWASNDEALMGEGRRLRSIQFETLTSILARNVRFTTEEGMAACGQPSSENGEYDKRSWSD